MADGHASVHNVEHGRKRASRVSYPDGVLEAIQGICMLGSSSDAFGDMESVTLNFGHGEIKCPILTGTATAVVVLGLAPIKPVLLSISPQLCPAWTRGSLIEDYSPIALSILGPLTLFI